MSGVGERARWFSYRRQRLNRAGRDPDGVLRDVVAVHSAHPTAPLSLLARCEPLTPDAFRELDALRLPAMRGSIQLLPRETAHLAFRAVPPPAGADDEALRYYGMDLEEYAELRETVLDAAEEPRSARELRELAGGGRTLAPVLAALTREGLLVRLGAHGLRSNELFYVAAHIPEADADEALAWLAEQYLRAFGPARPQDFAWWAGVPARRAQVALAGVATEELDDGLLLRSADFAEFERSSPVTATVDLLPKWDCYTMGYPDGGRERFAHADIADALYDAGGDVRPVVMVEGAAIGTWGVRPGAAMEFELELYEQPTPSVQAALEARADAIRALLA